MHPLINHTLALLQMFTTMLVGDETQTEGVNAQDKKLVTRQFSPETLAFLVNQIKDTLAQESDTQEMLRRRKYLATAIPNEDKEKLHVIINSALKSYQQALESRQMGETSVKRRRLENEESQSMADDLQSLHLHSQKIRNALWQQVWQDFSEAWENSAQDHRQHKQTLDTLRHVSSIMLPEELKKLKDDYPDLDVILNASIGDHLVKIVLIKRPISETSAEEPSSSTKPRVATYYFDARQLRQNWSHFDTLCSMSTGSTDQTSALPGVLEVGLPADPHYRTACLLMWPLLGLDCLAIRNYLKSLSLEALQSYLLPADLAVDLMGINVRMAKYLHSTALELFLDPLSTPQSLKALPQADRIKRQECLEWIVTQKQSPYAKLYIKVKLIELLFKYAKTCPEAFVKQPHFPPNGEFLRELLPHLQDAELEIDPCFVRMQEHLPLPSPTTVPECIAYLKIVHELIFYPWLQLYYHAEMYKIVGIDAGLEALDTQRGSNFLSIYHQLKLYKRNMDEGWRAELLRRQLASIQDEIDRIRSNKKELVMHSQECASFLPALLKRSEIYFPSEPPPYSPLEPAFANAICNFIDSKAFEDLPSKMESLAQIKAYLPFKLAFLSENLGPFLQEFSFYFTRNVVDNNEAEKVARLLSLLLSNVRKIHCRVNQLIVVIKIPKLEKISIDIECEDNNSQNNLHLLADAREVTSLHIDPPLSFREHENSNSPLKDWFPPNLRFLNVSQQWLTPADWQALSRLEHLEALDITWPKMFPSTLITLLPSLTRLKHIVTKNGLNDEAAQAMIKLITNPASLLKSLSLILGGIEGENEDLLDLDANFFNFLKGQTLDLFDVLFACDGIPSDIFSSLENCTFNTFVIQQSTDEYDGEVKLVKLPAMKVKNLVIISSCEIEGFEAVSQTLEVLLVSPQTLKSISFEKLSQCPHLHTLIIPGVKLTSDDLAVLDRMLSLKRVFSAADSNSDRSSWDWPTKSYTITPIPSVLGHSPEIYRKFALYKHFTPHMIKSALMAENADGATTIRDYLELNPHRLGWVSGRFDEKI